MTLVERYKNSKVFRSLRYTGYFAALTAAIMTFCALVDNRGIPTPYYLAALPVGVLSYFAFASFKLLRENHITNNHKSSPFLCVAGISPFSAFAFLEGGNILVLSGSLFGLFTLFLFIYSAALYGYRKIFPYFQLSAAFFLSGLSLYFFFAEFILLTFTGVNLAFPIVGTVTAILFSAVGLLQKKSRGKEERGIEERINGYLEKVFKKAPMNEYNLALREALLQKLDVFKKENEGKYQTEEAFYQAAIDSLGNFSELIKDRKDAFLARYTLTSDKFIDILMFSLCCLVISAVFVSLKTQDYTSVNGVLTIPPCAVAALLTYVRFVRYIMLKRFKYIGFFIMFVLGSLNLIPWIIVVGKAQEAETIVLYMFIPIAVIGVLLEVLYFIFKKVKT